jgi:hypothetical protein
VSEASPRRADRDGLPQWYDELVTIRRDPNRAFEMKRSAVRELGQLGDERAIEPRLARKNL